MGTTKPAPALISMSRRWYSCTGWKPVRLSAQPTDHPVGIDVIRFDRDHIRSMRPARNAPARHVQ
jgi:hypothetical protein